MLARLLALGLLVTLGQSDIERGLALARGRESERAAFHNRYILKPSDPSIEQIEVVTEYRRLVLLAEDHLSRADWMFTQGVKAAETELEPWRGLVTIVARVRFHPLNMYVSVPAIHVTLGAAPGGQPIQALDITTKGVFAPPASKNNKATPILGAIGNAIFDAALVGQGARPVIVVLESSELFRTTIDFGKLE